MRVAVGGLFHESHTFVAGRTVLADFEGHLLLEEAEIIRSFTGTNTEIGGMLDGMARHRMEPVPTLYAEATPAAMLSKETYEALRDGLVGRIARSGRLDGVALALHGAMVAEGYDDPEGDLLARVREVVGSIPLVITLDLHANISPQMVELVDALVGYDTYPHTDFPERGREAIDLLKKIADGALKPAKALVKPPLMPAVQGMYTAQPPMRDLIEMAHRAEQEPGVAAVTVAGGFPYADVPFAGFSVVAITDGDPEAARRHAQTVAEAAFGRRDAFRVEQVPVDQGVRQAIAAPEGPIVLVDAADNVGGGAPGDGTTVLESLLRHQAPSAVVSIADPEGVAEAIRAGVGNTVSLQVGGKVDKLHGAPVLVQGRVRTISDGEFVNKGSYMTGKRFQMGRTVVLQCGGITLLLSERKVMPFDAQHLRSVGIEPADYKIIVAKSAVAWRAAYGDIAKGVIELDTPGACTADLTRLPYRKVRRPIAPLDAVPSWP